MVLPIWAIPLVVKGAAAICGAAGIGVAANGVKKMNDAKEIMEHAKDRHEKNIKKFERENKKTTNDMDKLGELELNILHSFSEFSDIFEAIKNRPTFAAYTKNNVILPKYNGEKIKEVSLGAGILLGGLSGAGLGAAGGFAAAGATTAAAMALGTASTGTAIASLSGAAATNATLALLGGGTLAAGGGGMAAGAAALSAATLGVGLLVGGIIFSFAGSKMSDKADEAWNQMIKAEKNIKIICNYLIDLRTTSNEYYETLLKVNNIYKNHLNELKRIVIILKHTNWDTFTPEEKLITENTVLLVGLLYKMCKVEIVLQSKNEDELNTINKTDVDNSIYEANTILKDKF